MRSYPEAEVERVMRVQEIVMRVYAGKLNWLQAAEILHLSPRQIRRWKVRYEELGYDGLLDLRRRNPSQRRVGVVEIQKVLRLYREEYFDFNVKHFHEKLQSEHGVVQSYSWVKNTLQQAGLVTKDKRHGAHRTRRGRRPLPGMMMYLDGSTHQWLGEEAGYQDLLVVLDDATSEVYAVEMVEQEGTESVMGVLKEVVQEHGIFCALYTDRASHFVYTPKAGGEPDRSVKTQVQRALDELGIALIVAYSPQARGRRERLWQTWQGRLPQELRRAGITTMNEANRYLQQVFKPWHNQHLMVKAKEQGSAFVPVVGRDLERIFAHVEQRQVQNDNTVSFEGKRLQIPGSKQRYTYAKCRVQVYRHLDQTLSVYHGPHCLGCYSSDGQELRSTAAVMRRAA